MFLQTVVASVDISDVVNVCTMILLVLNYYCYLWLHVIVGLYALKIEIENADLVLEMKSMVVEKE